MAVTVADRLVNTVPATALNEALADPAGTATEAGTASRLLLLESATEEPPAGAAWLRLTVQVETARERSVVGPQLNELNTVVAADTASETLVVLEMAPSVAVTVTV